VIPTLRQLLGLSPWHPANDETPAEAREHFAWWGHLALLDTKRVAEECARITSPRSRRAG
jgi:hypothetical protein